MNAEALQSILSIVAKGAAIIEALKIAMESATPAFKALLELIEKVKSGEEVTAEELEAVEATLDGLLGQFNAPLPEE